MGRPKRSADGGLIWLQAAQSLAAVDLAARTAHFFTRYNDLGQATKEYQEHEGVQDGSTLYVGYNYDTTVSGSEYTKGLRPTSVRYPNARLVHRTYGSSGSTADAVGRVDAIKDDSGGSPGTSFSDYAYLGAGTIVVEDYAQPDVKLNYDSGTAGAYAGFDRFGRVVDHLWYDYLCPCQLPDTEFRFLL